MKQFILLTFVLLFAFVNDDFAQCSCGGNCEKKPIEVLMFHAKRRCPTCVAIEEMTQATLKEKFAKELKENEVVYKDIDITTEEGKKIAEKYKVTWSSLVLVSGEKVDNLTTMAFAYAKTSPKTFKEKFVAAMKAIKTK